MGRFIRRNFIARHRALVSVIITAFLFTSAWNVTGMYVSSFFDDHHVISVNNDHGKVHLSFAHPFAGSQDHQHDMLDGLVKHRSVAQEHPDDHEAHLHDISNEAIRTAKRFNNGARAPLQAVYMPIVPLQAPGRTEVINKNFALGINPSLSHLSTIVLLN